MSQRNEKLILPSHASFWRPLQRSKTIKYDLDKHLRMLEIIETTDKAELKKLEKKR
jgi:hypothetical protein